MILSRADLRQYREADRVALRRRPTIAARVADEIWRYERWLRRWEYELNNSHVVRARLAELRVVRLGNRLGFSVAPNVFGPGLSISHAGTLAVNTGARVGRNCRLSVNVVLGAALHDANAAPTLGDDCFLGPGAVVLGAVTLGSNTHVGANAVVTRSYPAGNVVLVGAPAAPLDGVVPSSWHEG